MAILPRFKRGDRVVFTSRQGGKLETTVRRVVLVKGGTAVIRYYALDGVPLLVADDIEAA